MATKSIEQFGDRRAARRALVLAMVAIALGAGPLWAQSRSSVGLSGVGDIGSTSSFGVNNFNNYSYGLRSSGGSSGGGQASMNYSVTRRGAATPRTSTGLSAGSSSKSYDAASEAYSTSSVRVSRNGRARELADPIATGQIALGTSMAITFGLGDSLLKADEPLSSFAPDNQGSYATLTRSAEQAVKRHQYPIAIDIYRQIKYIGDKLPESFLGAAHANFALGNYSTMAQNLMRAAELNPGVFSSRIKIRNFFSDPGEFIRLREQLNEYCTRAPNDAGAQFCRSYVLWLDGDKPAAREALAAAAENSTSPWLTQAVENVREALTAAENPTATEAGTAADRQATAETGKPTRPATDSSR